ncbi:MAG TPA: hypothetical protein PL110_07180 [Candidatus Eremiobacteraeota bacterium]|nr:MAG: hypothetical protein BWY64_02659 [bacterium ADurb.Bin363]HPZ07877.1 hypothetical protein [Candidatus Eremiobacteraeota bacterium]
MYELFTKNDLNECIEYIIKKFDHALYTRVDIVFEDNLRILLNYPTLMKDINKMDGVFRSYEDFEDKIRKKGTPEGRRINNSVMFSVFPGNLNIFAHIFESLIKNEIIFEIRVYE